VGLQPTGIDQVIQHDTASLSRQSILCRLKTTEQLITQGMSIGDVCFAVDVTQPIDHRWNLQHGGLQGEEARAVRFCEAEESHPTEDDEQPPPAEGFFASVEALGRG